MLKGQYLIRNGLGCYPIIIEGDRAYSIQENYNDKGYLGIFIKELGVTFETWRRGEGD